MRQPPPPTPQMLAIAACLKDLRLPPLPAEQALTHAVAAALDQGGIGYVREFSADRLAGAPTGCRFDFFCDGIVLELKRKATPVTRKQLQRYLTCTGVAGLILIAEKTVDLQSLSRTVNRPCLCCSIRRNWGITV